MALKKKKKSSSRHIVSKSSSCNRISDCNFRTNGQFANVASKKKKKNLQVAPKAQNCNIASISCRQTLFLKTVIKKKIECRFETSRVGLPGFLNNYSSPLELPGASYFCLQFLK
jgi:hypothetical protein